MTWWVANVYETQGGVALFSWVFWVIFSICLHELAHGYAAIWNGDNTPRELGRMTMNPLVHMGATSLLVFAVCGIAWGVMPTNPGRYRHERWGQVSVAAAGPLLNFILAALCTAGARVWLWATVTGALDVADNARVNVFTFLTAGAFLNLLLGIFNLLPAPPLDGSRVLGGLVPSIGRFYERPEVAMYGFIVLLIVFYAVGMEPLVRWTRAFSFDMTGRIAHALPDSGRREHRDDHLDVHYALTSPEIRDITIPLLYRDPAGLIDEATDHDEPPR